MESLQPPISAHKKDNNSHQFFESIIQKKLKNNTPFEILVDPWHDLVRANLISKIFKQKKIFNFLKEVLGSDLAYQDMPTLILNLPNQASSKLNYLYKDFHQEVWSGASTSTLQFWTPIFQTTNKGQISLIKNSHSWGHIPHRNRSPLELPNMFKEVFSNLNYGDVIFFHSLTVHRSNPLPDNSGARLALTCPIKNFKMPSDSFEKYSNWKILNLSPLSLIDKKLGNHQLSPFRLIDINNAKFTDGL